MLNNNNNKLYFELSIVKILVIKAIIYTSKIVIIIKKTIKIPYFVKIEEIIRALFKC